MASCTHIENSLQAYIDGELGDSDRVILEQHVGECRDCARSLRDHQRVNAQLFEAFAVNRLRGSIQSRVLENLPEMDPQQEDISSVNWRAKHPAGWLSRATRFVPVGALVFLVAASLVFRMYWPHAEQKTATVGVVSFSHGTVSRVSKESTHRENVSLNSYVEPGDRFETGSISLAMLSLVGPTHLKVNENTRIKVIDPRRIRVEEGLIWVDVGNDGSLFKVITPNGMITVFGTIFSVRVKDAQTTVTVERGLVQVENDERFCQLTAGQQVTMGPDGLSDPIRFEPSRIDAWASGIVPDERAEALFRETVLSHVATTELPGRMAFVIDTTQGGQEWHITAIRVYWKQDNAKTGHCAYDVYVSGGDGKPLLKGRIDGSLFDNKLKSYYEIPIPNAIANVKSLIVRLVPDHSVGTVVNDTLDVKAMARNN